MLPMFNLEKINSPLAPEPYTLHHRFLLRERGARARDPATGEHFEAEDEENVVAKALRGGGKGEGGGCYPRVACVCVQGGGGGL